MSVTGIEVNASHCWPSFVTTLITDLFKQHSVGGTASGISPVRGASPTPDVDDPIDYEAAEMAQAISDSIAVANVNQ